MKAQQIVDILMETTIEQQLVEIAKTFKHCGDYGELFYHPVKKEVHWTGADSDGDPEEGYTPLEEIETRLKLPGIKHVEIGDEWSPDLRDGWLKLIPEL